MVALPEQSVLAVGEEVSRIQGGMYDLRLFVVVWPLLDYQDLEIAVGLSKTTGNDTAS